MQDGYRYSFIIVERPDRLGGDELSARLHRLAELGYAGAELQLVPVPESLLDRLERSLGDCALAVPSFLTGEAYSEGLCLCSPDARIRKQTTDRLIGYLPTVKRFGAVMVIGLLQGRASDEPNADLATARIEEGLSLVAEAAEAAGVDVVIEPVNHLQVGFHQSVAEVRGLIERIKSPALRPMVDTLHMNIEEASLTDPVRACGTALRHVHLCESNGGRFGTGRVDFPAVLAALRQVGYGEWCSVKVYRHLDFAAAASTSIGFLRSIAIEGSADAPRRAGGGP
jgi:sugar phosphate isomerase/epimerase